MALTPPRIKNRDVADRLGIHPVSLSRLRNGYRKPSVDLINQIHEKLGWSVVAQTKAHQDKEDPLRYAREFRQFLEAKYGIRSEYNVTETEIEDEAE
jgi:transcriptional regulator with XRE-family HTH domain